MEQEPFHLGLRRYWWVPVIVAAAAAGAAGALAFRTPRYVATAAVVAQVPANGNGQALSFTDVATTSAVASAAISDSHVNESAEELEGNLSVVAGRSTLYKVSVADSSPGNATALANAVAVEAAALYQHLAGGVTDSIASDLQADRDQYHSRYLLATQALIVFEAQHPSGPTGTGSPTLDAQHSQLQLDQQAAQTLYLNVETAVAQARVNQVSAARNFSATVVDRATAHSQTLSLALKVAFAGALGLLLGLALAVVIEYVRRPSRATTDSSAGSNGEVPSQLIVPKTESSSRLAPTTTRKR